MVMKDVTPLTIIPEDQKKCNSSSISSIIQSMGILKVCLYQNENKIISVTFPNQDRMKWPLNFKIS